MSANDHELVQLVQKGAIKSPSTSYCTYLNYEEHNKFWIMQSFYLPKNFTLAYSTFISHLNRMKNRYSIHSYKCVYACCTPNRKFVMTEDKARHGYFLKLIRLCMEVPVGIMQQSLTCTCQAEHVTLYLYSLHAWVRFYNTDYTICIQSLASCVII